MAGDAQPGLRTPDMDEPGPRTPGDAAVTTLSQTGVAVDATGTTTLGTVGGDRDTVVVVTVTPTAADFDFNVTLGGETVFSAAQSPAAAEEEPFDPDADAAVRIDATDADVAIEVTSASATGGATADVDVEVSSEEQV